MQARPQGQFDRFQVHVPGLVSLGKDAGEQQVYFPRNFLMDRSRFFSCGVQPPLSCSTGRSAQIF